MTEHHDQARDAGGRDPLAELLQRAGARPGIDPAARQRVEQAAREAWMRQLRRHRQRRWVLSLAAAGAFAAVLAGWLWRLQPEPAVPLALRIERIDGRVARLVDGQRLPLQADRPLHRDDRLQLGADATLSLRDAAGGELRVGPGSEVSLRDERSVELHGGRLYVDNHGAAGSWTLSTPRLTARDIGTRFLVQHLQGLSTVAVRDGEVEIAAASGEQERIGAGRRLQLAADGEFKVSADPGHGADWDWVVDAAVPPALQARPVREFLRWYAGEAGLRLVVDEDAELARRLDAPLEGSVEGLGARQWLALAAVAAQFELSTHGDSGAMHVRAAR